MIFIAGMNLNDEKKNNLNDHLIIRAIAHAVVGVNETANMASCRIINLFDENLVVINNENKIN